MNFSFNIKKIGLLHSLIFLFLFQIIVTVIVYQEFLNSFAEQIAKNISTGNNELFLKADSLAITKEINALISSDYLRCASIVSQSEELFKYARNHPCDLAFMAKRKKFFSPSGELIVTLDIQLPSKMKVIIFLLIAIEVGLIFAVGLLIKSFKENKYREVAKFGYVAAKAAHDIRSPLSALAVISMTLPDSFGQQRDLLKSAVDRITGISKELYNLSKIQLKDVEDEGKQTGKSSKREMVDIIATVRGAVEEAKLATNGKASFHFQSNKELHFISLESHGLRRVLANLINNSIEAIGLEPLKINVQVLVGESKTVVTIHDNGIGIPPEVLRKLGKSRVSFGKSTKVDSGTGLGLKSAFEYMNSVGGSIGINSRLNHGTIISLELVNNS